MTELTPRERELVAIGAAMGSNCVPCIEYHIPEARRVGLADAQIAEAIQVADRVRQVPARKVLDAALQILREASVNLPMGGGQRGAAPVSSAAVVDRCCG